MDTKTRRMGRKGVSPVIATILLIAVTVVMAGILAAFVFTQGSQLESKPLVSLIVRDQPNTSTYLVLKHSGGDAVDWIDLRISVTVDADSPTSFQNPTDLAQTVLGTTQAGDDDFIAGESVIIDAESNGTALVEDSYYHVAVMHEPSGTALLDVNVQVTSA